MHLSRKWFGFASVTGISEVRQRECNRADVLTVNIDFRRRVDARVGDFKSQKRGERLRFNWKLEYGVLLRRTIKPNCFGCESGSDRAEGLDIFLRRVVGRKQVQRVPRLRP